MSVDQAHLGGHHAHDENIDHHGNANLAVFLGLVALTFFTASFVATNVYLRSWNPAKFVIHEQLLTDLPYFVTLLSLVSGILLLVAAALFRRDRWKTFNGVLAVATLVFFAELIMQFRLMMWFANYSQQVATIYTPTAAIELCLTLVSVTLLAVAGWYAGFPNKAKINAFFPVAMNVWLYTVVAGIVILLLEDVMSLGQFAAWCGVHLTNG